MEGAELIPLLDFLQRERDFRYFIRKTIRQNSPSHSQPDRSDRSALSPGTWMSAPSGRASLHLHACLCFQDFDGLTGVFGPGRLPRYPHGRPQDVHAAKLNLWAVSFLVPEMLRTPSASYSSLSGSPGLK